MELLEQLAIGLASPRGSAPVVILNPGSALGSFALSTHTFSFCVKGCCTSSGRSSPKALCSSHQMEACSFACQSNINIKFIKSQNIIIMVSNIYSREEFFKVAML